MKKYMAITRTGTRTNKNYVGRVGAGGKVYLIAEVFGNADVDTVVNALNAGEHTAGVRIEGGRK